MDRAALLPGRPLIRSLTRGGAGPARRGAQTPGPPARWREDGEAAELSGLGPLISSMAAPPLRPQGVGAGHRPPTVTLSFSPVRPACGQDGQELVPAGRSALSAQGERRSLKTQRGRAVGGGDRRPRGGAPSGKITSRGAGDPPTPSPGRCLAEPSGPGGTRVCAVS